MTGCHGIFEHKDTVLKRCPKALECQHYRNRLVAKLPADKLCNTVEFEHFVRLK